MINSPKSFNSRFAAAARGPGVGGIRTCVAKRPVERAMVSAKRGIPDFCERRLFKEDKITNAE